MYVAATIILFTPSFGVFLFQAYKEQTDDFELHRLD